MSSITEGGGKSSDELKREVDEAILKVDQDLNALRTEMSPGRIIDGAIFRGRSFRETVNHLRNNPVGTTFLSLGTLLLMEDENHNTGEDRLKYFAQQSSSFVQEAGHKAKEVMDKASEKAKEQLDDARSFVSETVDHVKAKTGDTVDRVRSALSDGSDSSMSGRDESSRIAQQAKEAWSKLNSPEFRPITIAALGLGLGSVLGSALPLDPRSANGDVGDVDAKAIAADVQAALKESSRRLISVFADELKQTLH